MTTAWVPLAEITLASTDAEITFSSIPATYRDLVLVTNFSVSSTTQILVRFNGDTGSNYSNLHMSGTSSGPLSASSSGSSVIMDWFNVLANNPFDGQMQIEDYSATDKHKTVLQRNNWLGSDSQRITSAMASRWASTSAVNSITIFNGTFTAGSTFALYGSNKLV